jgi:hypothetical protein
MHPQNVKMFQAYITECENVSSTYLPGNVKMFQAKIISKKCEIFQAGISTKCENVKHRYHGYEM